MNPKLRLEILRRKICAHRLGLGGFSDLVLKDASVVQIPLEGFKPDLAFVMEKEMFESWITKNKEIHSILKNHKEMIIDFLEILKNPLLSNLNKDNSLDQSIKQIKQNKPLVVLGGFTGHVIYLVFEDSRLAILNRGLGGKKKTVTTIEYPSDLKERELKELILKFNKFYKNIEEFKEMVNSLSSLGYLINSKNESVIQKPQKIGHCTFANVKAVILYLLVHYCGQEDGRKIYKDYTLDSRDETLKLYRDSQGDPYSDSAFLAKLEAKNEAYKKSHGK
jgi:hypothetical protein